MVVFLVDDDYEDHEIFKMALDRVGPDFEFISAESGIEALDRFKMNTSFLPDIVFLDLNMPRMNGKECVRELRKMEHLDNVPVILYSTHDGQKEVKEAKEAGASDFITKPSNIPEFTRTLETIFGKHVKTLS